MPGYELVGEEEKSALIEIFDDGGILFAHGFDALRSGRYRVREFERAFASYLGVNYAQAVSSGTAAIKVALYAAGVRAGDEVITQTFTFIATIEAILDLGATPVFVDIDHTLNIDPSKIKSAITQKTKAIMPVHMLGVAADMDAINAIAEEYGLIVLDDNCESLGAEWGEEKLGIQGDACAWSFDAGKTIITGEGGMVTTNSLEIYNIAREYHDHGHQYNPQLPRGRDTRVRLGFNYRMSELQAAVGLAQLKKLDFIVQTNRRIYDDLAELLGGFKNVFLREIPIKNNPLCDTFIFSFRNKAMADTCVQMLAKNGLGTKNVPDAIEWHFAAFWEHLHPLLGISTAAFKEKYRDSESVINRCVALPILVKTTEAELENKKLILREIFTLLENLKCD